MSNRGASGLERLTVFITNKLARSTVGRELTNFGG
jgi:hypothetical protein